MKNVIYDARQKSGAAILMECKPFARVRDKSHFVNQISLLS